MQPGEAQKGVSNRSDLFDSLRGYLNNKTRLQPIIGLGSIIECVKVGARDREVLYLCEVCVRRLGKADMRNHILGSQHRYNYIKSWHPHLLSECKETPDMSKLAWPLMEIAKTIEGREGAGDIRLLEVEDAVYQKMATHCENDAVTLINSSRDWQQRVEPESRSETTSLQTEHYPIRSRIHSTPPLSTVAPPVKSEVRLKHVSPSQSDMSPELPVLPRNSNGFLDGYMGPEPLIGLFRVVECRSEGGRTYAFLCHCCRIRSSKKDIIKHLTSSSHIINYLMETHPEQVEPLTTDTNHSCPFLQSLAKKVEQEEGRGEMEVVNVPESLCILLTGKSYHWCIKMLCKGWTHTNTQKTTITVKGPSGNKTPVEGVPEKRRKKAAKRRKLANTVFKVSMPLTKGAVLLERTSFSEDSLPMSCSYSSDLTPSPVSVTLDHLQLTTVNKPQPYNFSTTYIVGLR